VGQFLHISLFLFISTGIVFNVPQLRFALWFSHDWNGAIHFGKEDLKVPFIKHFIKSTSGQNGLRKCDINTQWSFIQ
jgi:hypothetical protein